MWRTAAVAVVSLAAGVAAAVWVAQEWQARITPAAPAWTELPNGLRFRVQRVKGAKGVAVVTVFGIGSDSDPRGRIGLAHLAEHVYVTCAAGAEAARTVDEWDNRYGGQCSATTHDEFTCIAGVVAPRRLEHELADIAARMSALRIESTDLDRERPRVLEQIAGSGDLTMGLGRARQLARARILSLPHAGHSGGLPADVERLTLADVQEFARRFYRPANARIAVAGDVDPDEVAEFITKSFGTLPAGEPAPAPPEVEPYSEILRIERDAMPGPGYEPCQWVWIAYPRRRDATETDTVTEALGLCTPSSKSASEGRSEGFFLVQQDERSVLVGWYGDERPVEEVTRKFDACVEDFTRQATGARCAAEIREAIRGYDEAVEELKKYGFALPARVAPGPLEMAFQLAVPGAVTFDERLAADVARLTNEDIRRSIATWHRADRRVVVDVRCWRPARDPEPDTDADEKTDEPAPTSVPSTPPK